MATYMVTGGAGFIGSHIAARLLRDGHSVRVVDNLLTGRQRNLDYLHNLNGQFTFYNLSITDYAALEAVLADVDVVFHQAALSSVARSMENPHEAHEICATGTLNVLRAARQQGVRRVVYAASASAYGDVAGEAIAETCVPAPISPYGVAKLAGEYYCQMYTQAYGLETVALRYFNVFGERQDPRSDYAAVIPKFITQLLADETPTIFGSGQQTRDFTHVENIVQGNLLAAHASAAVGHVMNLATGDSISLLHLLERLSALMGKDITPRFAPMRSGDITHSSASIARARTLLNYAPVVDFDTGLARTVAWYRQQREAQS